MFLSDMRAHYFVSIHPGSTCQCVGQYPLAVQTAVRMAGFIIFGKSDFVVTNKVKVI